ncbi:hypothetical protein Lgra_1757 [Legionella gratiana]|uniref:Coiled coil protein n=1 Tax=Legionella gratiana TaxID=45066 RepID=A0A378J9Y4_9GAMM|nr:hypothetical protein [Legionella gratiana]KTD10791.1 hypothetical protein Lgra_1757 [Legionella gratiana]STX43948.1 Uncharacterised protein [Legionella gratiana]
MQDISAVKIGEKSAIPLSMLQEARQEVIRDARLVVDDLRRNLVEFNTKLERVKSQLPNRVEEYQKLKNDLIGLKVGNNDKEMDKFLVECDKAIMQTRNLDERLGKITEQIQKMQRVIQGLKSRENEAVKTLIKDFDARNKWYTIGMGKKARKIEAALANVPIEERAKLLSSNDQTVTDVLDAIAWKRKSIFSSAKNKKEKLK